MKISLLRTGISPIMRATEPNTYRPVNPQVPGSSPGRGARYLNACSLAGFFIPVRNFCFSPQFVISMGVFLLSPMHALADEWTTADTWREAAYLSLLTVDWAQTRNFLRNPDCYEQNKLLGQHPEQSHLDAAVIITGLAHVYIASVLPEKYRAPFQYISIGIEGGAVAHNFSLGATVKF